MDSRTNDDLMNAFTLASARISNTRSTFKDRELLLHLRVRISELLNSDVEPPQRWLELSRQARIEDRKEIAYAALLRADHAGAGRLSPSDFILQKAKTLRVLGQADAALRLLEQQSEAAKKAIRNKYDVLEIEESPPSSSASAVERGHVELILCLAKWREEKKASVAAIIDDYNTLCAMPPYDKVHFLLLLRSRLAFIFSQRSSLNFL